MKVVFIQSFSLGDVGGGPKIIRSVAEQAPVPVASICTGFGKKHPAWSHYETLVPIRPTLGRIDHSRFEWLGGYLEDFWIKRFEHQLEEKLVGLRATDVHLLPHSWGDFAAGYRVAQRLGLRVHVSIHDDFSYTAKSHIRLKELEGALKEVWQKALNRFVISHEMGVEYCQRYGERSYLIHTDGCVPGDELKYTPPSNELRLYFMGMFNHTYLPNFQSLMAALEKHQTDIHKNKRLCFTVRTHGFNPGQFDGARLVKLLPFASPEIVTQEMRFQHLLYLPLPLDPEWSNLCRFSLSTKMVSYMASGVPILYHGPDSSAVSKYLGRNDAAFQIHSNDPAVVAQSIKEILSDINRMKSVGQNAHHAAKLHFDQSTLKSRFWDAVLSS